MRNEPAPPGLTSSVPLAPFFGFALAVTMIAAIGVYAVRSLAMRATGNDCYEQELGAGEQQKPYGEWPKPLVAIVLSGQMHGFYDKCGCSEPQYGGLPRRYNFIQSLKAKKWDVVGIDLGEMADFKGIQKQNWFKYELSIRALAAMNYRAVGIGRDEILMGLGEGLAQVEDDKRPFPRPVSLSLKEAAAGGEYHKLNARPYEIIDLGNPKIPKIGVISLLGPDVREELKPLEKFVPAATELPNALKAFADAGVEIGVILHHEYPTIKLAPGIAQQMAIEKIRKDLAEAAMVFCDQERLKNKKIPEIQLMMVLTQDSEPSAIPRPIGPKTQLIEIGHKGKYVGLVGVYREGKNFRLQYEMVLMDPDWETKEGQEKTNPVLALMENYNNNLKRNKMLDVFARSTRPVHFNQRAPQGLKATYVGSGRCSDCHADAYKVWEKTPHFSATKTLEDKVNPAGRQFDPECMACHTTGLKHPGGYNDLVTDLAKWPNHPAADPKKLAKHNQELRGVGCESCHGPGSEHVKNPKDKNLYALINPYGLSKGERDLEAKAAKKNINQEEMQQLNQLVQSRLTSMAGNMCMKCHDMENDVNWGKPDKSTADKWRGLVHRTPKNNNGGAIAPPDKNDAPPAIQNDTPPIVIEIIQDKKK